MKKPLIATAALLLAVGYSAVALAAAHYFNVTGEGIGHTQEEAVDNAWRVADEACYQTWGQSAQQATILAQHVQPDTGYWYAKVSLGCTVYD